MKHKNIAVLITALDSDTQRYTLSGIEEYGKEKGYNIAVFLWFTGAYERDRHNVGELNIAYLPDLNLFDGIIIFSNVLHMEYNRKKIEELIENVSCPVVCIGDYVGDSYFIGTDTYASMRAMVEHFVVHHNMKRIHFVKGVEGNGDAETRFRAYIDVLTEHNIPIEAERVTQGDYYVTGGELAFKEIVTSRLEFPEAVVCSNDVMAIALCDILTEKGYRVPEDVAISGYDCIPGGQNHIPRLATVKCNLSDLGRESCRIVIDLIEGKEVPKETYLSDELVLAESCGCGEKTTEDSLRKYEALLTLDNSQRKVIDQMLLQEKRVMECDGFEGWRECIKEFIRQINPGEFYCCANDDFVQNVFDVDVMDQDNATMEERLAYSPKMNVIMAYQNGMFTNKPSFESRLAFDDLFKDSENAKMYIFSPMHYLDRNFGYFIFSDTAFPIGNPLYISWLISMGDAIENIRKQNLLKNAMARLDEMYIRDSLTGVYNRFGMERYFTEIKRKCIMSRAKLQVSFADLDGLKSINDTYGHEEGDRIISAAANILFDKAGRYYVVRFGGDEFVVMGAVHNDKEVQNYWDGVMEEIKQYNNKYKRNAELSLSYGYDIFPVSANLRLEECINIVDKKMYEAKSLKKKLQ